jgi:hypothetical protein
MCHFTCNTLQQWIQPARLKRAPKPRNKSTREREASKSNETHNAPTNAVNIPSTLQPNNIKNRENGIYDKQKENITSMGDTQLDLRKNPNWEKDLLVSQRLFAHHTLSSIRKSVNFVCSNAPRDKLDFVLDSTYRHENAVFPDTTDVYLQPETLGHETW